MNANEFPLRFNDHDFDALCYNTIGCRVSYAGTIEVNEPPDVVSPPPLSADYRKHWGFASHVGIRNFPPPAFVEWKSLDGVPHEAHIDIGAIFKDELVLHHVPLDEIPKRTAATPGGPGIFLEVNDRTISVYMQSTIALKDLPTRRSAFVNELNLAWTHTY
ncbi:hypothetical protein [Cognatiluteimonas telluris]|uniref:hypothetical protein n=1 Tax=Cognatiluteimonas telluris TaxID=1104775 RepID=UPI001FAF3C8A|nr:hypothetical protein [Lysobacter telluris]